MLWLLFFFFNDAATTEIYTLSLHDALPISPAFNVVVSNVPGFTEQRYLEGSSLDEYYPLSLLFHGQGLNITAIRDRKSTRLNSSHANISYAVFCLKKKNKPSSLYS